jgi:hypothetical protein
MESCRIAVIVHSASASRCNILASRMIPASWRQMSFGVLTVLMARFTGMEGEHRLIVSFDDRTDSVIDMTFVKAIRGWTCISTSVSSTLRHANRKSTAL